MPIGRQYRYPTPDNTAVTKLGYAVFTGRPHAVSRVRRCNDDGIGVAMCDSTLAVLVQDEAWVADPQPEHCKRCLRLTAT